MADFKITYKGNSLVLPFDYKCFECGDISTIEHKRSDDMHGRICSKCNGELGRYITSAVSKEKVTTTGKPYKVTYKGGSRLVNFEYICYGCHDISFIEHKRSEDMRHRTCEKCGDLLSRHITSAPRLDADYHEAHLTRNIGWDS